MLERDKLKPKIATEEYSKLVEKETERIVSLFREESSCEIKKCEICSSNKFKKEFSKLGFKHVKCLNCGFIFVNPKPTPKLLKYYYENSISSKFFQQHIIEPTREYRLKNIAKPRSEWLNSFFNQPGKYLDVGCSTGMIIESMKNLNWTCQGSEFSLDAIKIAKHHGLNVSNSDLNDEDIFEKGSFDLITLFEVLEHVSDISDLITNIRSLLKKEGLLIITVPNINGIEFKFIKENHTNILPPAHINYFSEKSFQIIAEKFKFKIEKISTPGKLDVSNILDAINKKRIDNKKEEIFIELIKRCEGNEILMNKLQEIISSSGFSGHMAVVFKKI